MCQNGPGQTGWPAARHFGLRAGPAWPTARHFGPRAGPAWPTLERAELGPDLG
ncbi:hypothetical protein TorRG33x02_280900, partial [Trema orientale]